MLAVIQQRIESIGTGASQGRTRLQIVSLVGPSHTEPDYQLLSRENLGKVKVTEISEAGTVPILKVQNLLEDRVFLMDG